ncbi:hypothetical protein ACGVWS_01220 [Enterobacteriaceae bacterium LUAb1]
MLWKEIQVVIRQAPPAKWVRGLSQQHGDNAIAGLATSPAQFTDVVGNNSKVSLRAAESFPVGLYR